MRIEKPVAVAMVEKNGLFRMIFSSSFLSCCLGRYGGNSICSELDILRTTLPADFPFNVEMTEILSQRCPMTAGCSD
jgi:hypothetical protein